MSLPGEYPGYPELCSPSAHTLLPKRVANLWEAYLWDPQAPELGQLMANVGLSENHKIKFTLLSSRANQGQAFLWWIVQWDTYVTLLLVLCGEASSHSSFKSKQEVKDHHKSTEEESWIFAFPPLFCTHLTHTSSDSQFWFVFLVISFH